MLRHEIYKLPPLLRKYPGDAQSLLCHLAFPPTHIGGCGAGGGVTCHKMFLCRGRRHPWSPEILPLRVFFGRSLHLA